MSTLNAKCRASFYEWLEDIDADDLKNFVFGNRISRNEFKSNNFKLAYAGVSNGEPVDCHMIEARINGATKDKQLKRLLQSSASMSRDPTRLAFVLVPKSLDGHCMGQHVRQALRESPVEGKSVVNKVHVQWAPTVKLEDGEPRFKAGSTPFVFEKIAFEGFNVDGTIAAKKGKGKK